MTEAPLTKRFYIGSFCWLSMAGSFILMRGDFLQATGLFLLFAAVGILADGITDKLLTNRSRPT